MTHPEPIDSMIYPRYSGIATFMRLPHLQDTRELDVAFVGVPFDTAAGYRVGARLAPQLPHATTFRRAHEDGLLQPGKVVQMGIRGSLFYPDDLKWSKEHYRMMPAHEIHGRDMDGVVAEVREIVGAAPVYFTFDID